MSDTIRERFGLWNKVEKKFYFFQLDRPQSGKWEGYKFLREQHGDNFPRVTNREKRELVIKHFEQDKETAFANYGKHTGHCGMCGKSLTDQESIDRGIGPVCASRL